MIIKNFRKREKIKQLIDFDESFFKLNHPIFRAAYDDNITLLKQILSKNSDKDLLNEKANLRFSSNLSLEDLQKIFPLLEMFLDEYKLDPIQPKRFLFLDTQVGLAEVAVAGGALKVLKFLGENKSINVFSHFFPYSLKVRPMKVANNNIYNNIFNNSDGLKDMLSVFPGKGINGLRSVISLNLFTLSFIYGNQDIINFIIDFMKSSEIKIGVHENLLFKTLKDILLFLDVGIDKNNDMGVDNDNDTDTDDDYGTDTDEEDCEFHTVNLITSIFKKFLIENSKNSSGLKFNSSIEDNFKKIDLLMYQICRDNITRVSQEDKCPPAFESNSYLNIYLNFYLDLIKEAFASVDYANHKFLELSMKPLKNFAKLEHAKVQIENFLLRFCEAQLLLLEKQPFKLDQYSKISKIYNFLIHELKNKEAPVHLSTLLLSIVTKEKQTLATKNLCLIQSLFSSLLLFIENRDDRVPEIMLKKYLGYEDVCYKDFLNSELNENFLLLLNVLGGTSIEKLIFAKEYKRLTEQEQIENNYEQLEKTMDDLTSKCSKRTKLIKDFSEESTSLQKNFLFLQKENEQLFTRNKNIEETLSNINNKISSLSEKKKSNKLTNT